MRIEAFERLKKLRADIEKCVEMETAFRASAERMTTLLSGMPNAGSNAYSRVEEYAVKLVQSQELRKRLELELLTEQMKWFEIVSNAIDDKIVRQIISQHYIEGKSWRAISSALHYSNSQIFRFNRKGLQILGNVERALKESEKK